MVVERRGEERREVFTDYLMRNGVEDFISDLRSVVEE